MRTILNFIGIALVLAICWLISWARKKGLAFVFGGSFGRSKMSVLIVRCHG